MESLSSLLHAFYSQPLSTDERANIHRVLISSLTDTSHQKAAIEYVKKVAEIPQPVDPFLLHHALHTIETLARTSFSDIQPSDLDVLQSLLLSFLINAHVRHLSDAPQAIRIPPHALNKAAAALVALGKRHWLAGFSNFPNALQRLVDSPAHTSRSLASLLSGHAILITLLDDALSPRRDLRADDAARLRRLIASHAVDFLSALEVAQRAAGPNFPPHVAPSAARSVASLSRIEPSVASHACSILARSATNRYDDVGAQILTSIADILSMPATVACTPIIDVVVTSLESLANGSVSAEHIGSPLLAVVEVLVPRLIFPKSSQGLDSVLNSLMGVTVHWASQNPPWLLRSLDTWIAVIETFEDFDLNEESLLQRVYSSVTTLCAERAFFASNSPLLSSLRVATERPISQSVDLHEWNASAESMAEVATNPLGPSAAAIFFDHIDADVVRDIEDDDDLEGCDAVSATSYSAKCIETLAVVAQMSPSQAHKAAHVAIRAINGVTDLTAASLADLNSAFSLAYLLAGVLPHTGAEARALAETVCSSVAAGAWRVGRAGVMAMRATAAFVPSFSEIGKHSETSEKDARSARSLLSVVKVILEWEGCTERLATAAALVVVSFDSIWRNPLFSSNPPFDAATIVASSHVSVAELGAASLVRWTVAPPRDPNGVRARWSDEEWVVREQKLAVACSIMFNPLTQTVNVGEAVVSSTGLSVVARQTAILRTIVLAVYGTQGRTVDAVWRAGIKGTSTQLILLLRIFTRIVLDNRIDDSTQRALVHVVASILHCVAAIALVCGRRAATDGFSLTIEAVQAALPIANANVQNGMRVAHGAMRLIRDRLAAGDDNLLVAGVDVAIATLNMATDDDVCEVAVSLLSEGLKCHWQKFWPGDKIALNGNHKEDGSTGDLPKSNDEVQSVYFKALSGIVSGLRSRQLTVCRASLLALQQLDASRRIYSREVAFRRTGAGRAVVTECIRIIGGGGDAARESLADEAVEVLWGIARSDVSGFADSIADVVREVSTPTLDAEAVGHVVKLFQDVGDHSSFSRAVFSAVNDMVFFGKLQPSL